MIKKIYYYLISIYKLSKTKSSFLGVLTSRISSNVIIDKSAIISKSLLVGNINIDKKSRITNCVLSGYVDVGRYSSVNGPNTFISSRINKITIGSFCSIARGVQFQEDSHKYNLPSSYTINKDFFNVSSDLDYESKGEINIGNDVWIGLNAIILGGVNIGHGVIIGAGSIVTKNIPNYAIAVGNPARVIGYRFNKERIDELLVLEWWNWDENKIKINKFFFTNKIQNNVTLDYIL